MKRLALALLVSLLLVGCASLPPGDYALVPLSGQTVQPGEWMYGGPEGQYRVEVWESFEDVALATATPRPTYTALPTLTPYPTYTPYPTTTPPGAQASPTPDTGIAPAPTSEAICEARVEGDYHRVRAERSTDAPVVGSMAPASWMRVERIVRNAEGEWLYGTGENANGAAITGWALVTENLVLQDSQACWAVPYEDEIAPLPTPAPTATPAPPATPVPTGPAPGDCTYSHIYAMTMRSGPGTGYSRVGTLPANTRALVGHIYPDTASEQWVFITYEGVTGWVAVRAGGVTYGALSGDCAGVRRDAPRLQGVGWTTMLGYDPALYEVGEALRDKGYAPSIVLTDNAGEACAWAARNWQVVVRPWYVLGLGDDPDLTIPPEASAYARVEALAGYVTLLCADSANVTVQLTNETRWPSADYLNRWIVAACEVCDARGLSCLPVVFSVGTPELDWMPTLRPALAALVARDYALGYNAYGYARDALLCDTAAQHTVWRPRLMRLAAGEPFPRVVVTEAARGAGDVAPIVSDAACFARAAVGIYDTVALWYTGHDSAWRDGRWYADTMRALVAAL